MKGKGMGARPGGVAALLMMLAALLGLHMLVGSGYSQTVRDDAYLRDDRFPGYYYYDEKVELIVDESPDSYITVKFRAGTPQNERNSIMAQAGFVKGMDLSEKTTLPVSLFEVKENVQGRERIEKSRQLQNNEHVEFAYPTLSTLEGKRLGLTDEFSVKFKSDLSEEDIAAINKENGAEVVEKNEKLGFYRLRIADARATNSLAMANKYFEDGYAEWSTPDFVTFIIPAEVPNDPYLGQQWHLNNVGATAAWSTSKGSGVRIAILDDGVDQSHPDLAGKLVPVADRYDAAFNDNDPQPNSWDGHGTSCAGIAAAVTNNAAGVAGVGWDAAIMPVRIAYSNTRDGEWVAYTSYKVNGFVWAADHGARVLSNSWGHHPESTQLTEAIRYARNQGSVVLFAAGNSNTSVAYPARLPEVIAVGASNLCDGRKTPTNDACNNYAYWWGSNYGPELDVVAPGISMMTTDITGAGGYEPYRTNCASPAGDNYYACFGGTSAATPVVAGLAALILSVDPTLTPGDVQEVIEYTAKDVGPAGRDNEHGWGRVNAAEAVRIEGVLAIREKYNSLSGAPGAPRSGVSSLYSAGQWVGQARDYQAGDGWPGKLIWDRSLNQAYWVYGGILAKYLSLGGHTGFLSLPRSDEYGVSNGRASDFAGGNIYWVYSLSRAHEVHGDILSKYLALGGPAGFLGLPGSDEYGVAGGRASNFVGGRVYWSSPTGAREVHGTILSKYLALGGPSGFLGFPVSDELDTEGVSGAKESHFQGGRVYWSGSTSAHEVHGAILTKYLQLGGPASALGLPTSDEYSWGAGRRNDFQHGYIYWTAQGGAQVYYF